MHKDAEPHFAKIMDYYFYQDCPPRSKSRKRSIVPPTHRARLGFMATSNGNPP